MNVQSFKPMRMHWRFVIAMAARELKCAPTKLGPKSFACWANGAPELFPDGMDETQARWILANPDAFTDGQP